jgi:MinD superfamily P-loop ATPase
MIRQIVSIDQELCNGCGACVTPCAEGAIEIIDGKAIVRQEELCDGAGFCLGVCPQGAMTITERDAPDFDEQAVHAHSAAIPKRYIAQSCFRCASGEDRVPLFPIRFQGASQWVCAQCLPALIHGH